MALAAMIGVTMGPFFITVIGQCMGSGDTEAAEYYFKKMYRMTLAGSIAWNILDALDGCSPVNHMESRNGLHTLEHAEKIGLGSRTYQLVSIDREGEAAGNRQVKLTAVGRECIAALYDNPSAGDLYSALPLEQSTVTEGARLEG